MAEAAAEARWASLIKKAVNDASQLDAADRAYNGGDLVVASRIYVSLTLGRQKTPASTQARQRLEQMAAEARKKRQAIDDELSTAQSKISPSELLGLNRPLDGNRSANGWSELVTAAFERYAQLAEDYRGVPEVNRELKSSLAKQRLRPEYARVLNEPKANALLELARKHEREDHACCAYWVYREAARLTPAPSGELARKRFEQMQRDPQVVAAAEGCRQLQHCHRTYNRAKSLAESRPKRAKELFLEILEQAPPDSEVYRAARQQIAILQ